MESNESASGGHFWVQRRSLWSALWVKFMTVHTKIEFVGEKSDPRLTQSWPLVHFKIYPPEVLLFDTKSFFSKLMKPEGPNGHCPSADLR